MINIMNALQKAYNATTTAINAIRPKALFEFFIIK